MNSCDVFPRYCSAAGSFESGPGGYSVPPMRIRELAERDRRRLLMHFLALKGQDRRLRFGAALSDEALTHHVQHIDFRRDVLFGAFDASSTLIGVGHLVFVPRDALPSISDATSKPRLAEAGLSVLETEREKGTGTHIFSRMVARCRSEDVDTIIVHCLEDNEAMMHIARKICVAIRFGSEKSDACLILPDEESITLEKRAVRFGESAGQAAPFLRGKRR